MGFNLLCRIHKQQHCHYTAISCLLFLILQYFSKFTKALTQPYNCFHCHLMIHFGVDSGNRC